MQNDFEKKLDIYLRIFKKSFKTNNFFETTKEFCNTFNFDEKFNSNKMFFCSGIATAPIGLSYVIYILKNAYDNGVERLYFLARDGFILLKIARILCEKYDLNIDCRYLCCSRFSLIKSLAFTDFSEYVNKISFEKEYNSKKAILLNTGVEFQKFSYIDDNDIDVNFKKGEKDSFIQFLKGDKKFKEIITSEIKEDFLINKAYFEQEGLFEDLKYAIVDLGWLGNMQKYISRIVGKEIIGYYFAMADKKNKTGGIYNCFYSDNSSMMLYNKN